MLTLRTLIAGLCLPVVAMAQERPADPVYFAGLYERIGRTGAGMVDDRVRITALSGLWGIAIRDCATGEILSLTADDQAEVPNAMTSADGTMLCEYYNTATNMPALLCQSGPALRLTYWPLTDDPAAC